MIILECYWGFFKENDIKKEKYLILCPELAGLDSYARFFETAREMHQAIEEKIRGKEFRLKFPNERGMLSCNGREFYYSGISVGGVGI